MMSYLHRSMNPRFLIGRVIEDLNFASILMSVNIFVKASYIDFIRRNSEAYGWFQGALEWDFIYVN